MAKPEPKRLDAVETVEPELTGKTETKEVVPDPKRQWVFRSVTDKVFTIQSSFMRDVVDRYGRTGQRASQKAVQLTFRRRTFVLTAEIAKALFDLTAEEVATLAVNSGAYGGINNERNGQFFLVSCPAWKGLNKFGSEVEFPAHELDDEGRRLVSMLEQQASKQTGGISVGAKATGDVRGITR